MRSVLSIALILAVTGACLAADSIQVSRLGKPGDMQMTLYVGDDRATVREVRPTFLAPGPSQVTFAWTDADIDPASLRLRAADGLTIGTVNRVPGDDRAIVWDVQADRAQAYDLTFEYTMKGLRWRPMYSIVCDPAAGAAEVSSVLQLNNDTRISLEGVKVGLVTGRVGLLDSGSASIPATIPVSDSLSMDPGWMRTVPFVGAQKVPAEIIYRLDRDKYGDGLQRVLALHLEKSTIPKDLALPGGRAEVRTVQGDDPPRILRTLDLAPKAGELLEIPLGREDDVYLERKLIATDKTSVETDRYGRISGFDTVEDYRITLRSRLAAPVHCEVLEPVLAAWGLVTKTPPKKTEGNIATFDLTLTPGEAQVLELRLTKHSGSRIK